MSSHSLWAEADRLISQHPELVESARSVRGFGDGARWMHEAMKLIGWKLPPFGNQASYERRGWIKYGICSISALTVAFCCWLIGLWPLIPFLGILVFYIVEAQMVFVFPEALSGNRFPWHRSRGLTAAVGGTWRVMITVMPIAVKMLSGWMREEGWIGAWCRGCLSIVIWHRQLRDLKRSWTTNEETLPRLEIGTIQPLLLRQETVIHGLRGPLRILWISDLHWRSDADALVLFELLSIAKQTKPDAFVLGGDFLDSVKGARLFRMLLRQLNRIAPCVALPGNHDTGRTHALIRKMVEDAGVAWLPDIGKFPISNKTDDCLTVTNPTGLTKMADHEVGVLCVHKPSELNRVNDVTKVCCAMAGHLHGGQWVLWKSAGRLHPACWVYRHACLRKLWQGVNLIVCRGAGDTLPLRWNCPREVILCEIL